ncbi:MAG: hypothetical protein GVY13_19235 [Alphaproteobacteria bacterium]|jgi:cholesterol transport system auxiliary component|nr:hypothetical protein [Alphaproteobacteria bacterium]
MATPTRRQLIRAGTALSPLLLAGGCGSLASAVFSGPPQTYVLTPKSTFPADLPRVDWQLLVEEPVASAGLDTARIALLRAPTELDYYADVVWSTRAPEMVQTLLVESFENADRIVSIGRESIGLRADYVLKTELREFQAVYAEGYTEDDTRAPTVFVRVNAKLVQTPQRVIIAGRNFEDRRAVASNTIAPIIQAFDEALGEVMKNLVAWTLRQGQENWVQRPDARFRGGGRE